MTATRLLDRDRGKEELDAYVADLNGRVVRAGRDEPPPVPEDATLVPALELTAHEGHFIGRALNRLLVYEKGVAPICARREPGTRCRSSSLRPTAWQASQPSMRSGAKGREEQSMLHQIAKQTAA